MSDPIEAIRKRVAAWGREDSRVLLAEIDRLRADNAGLRLALQEIVNELGSGPCPANTCPGCGYEMTSASSTAADALAGRYPTPLPVPPATDRKG